jgi:lipid A ethanolaminephosphotransferase
LTRPTLRVESLVALIALYCVVFGNGPWWSAVSAGRSWGDPGTWLFMSACFVLLVALHFIILSLLAARVTVKPWLTLVIVATSFAVYWMRTYAVLLDSTMLRNVVRTDVREARELLSLTLLGNVLLWAAPPTVFIWWVQLSSRPVLRALGFRLATMAIALVLCVGAVLSISRDFTSLMRNRHEVRFMVTPGNLIYGLVRNAVTDVRVVNASKITLGADARETRDATNSSRPRVFVFVLGETARAHNFSLFGYDRPTNPELPKLNIIAFPNVKSCGTSTEVSVPCLFSPYGRADYDEELIHRTEGMLHVMSHAGLALTWIDNQSGCKGVCDAQGLEYRKPDISFAPDLCEGEDCLDEILVRSLKADLESIKGDTVIVMHQMGNHGPAYYRRYPPEFRRFTPDCETTELRKCSAAEVVNAYDNAILYTDHVLAEIIGVLDGQSQRFDTAFLYVSDHGESLGESGLYLHGIPYAFAPDLQTHVPMILWMSDGFAAASKVDVDCLRGRADAAYSHDNIFHSLLGILDVVTSVYNRDRDLFAPCRKSAG